MQTPSPKPQIILATSLYTTKPIKGLNYHASRCVNMKFNASTFLTLDIKRWLPNQIWINFFLSTVILATD